MNRLIDIAIEHNRTMFLLLALIFISGVYSYIAIPKESRPDIPLPVIYVSLNHEGISPEDAVNLLVKPMEQELRDIEGLDELEANAFEGGANIVVKFLAGADNKKALDDVRNKVDIAKADLPEDADEPTVQELNMSTFPILTVILKGNLPERNIKRIAEDLQDDIEGLSSVLEANIRGFREEQVVVEVDRALLETYNISPESMITAFVANNQLVAAGNIELTNGKYAVKVPGLFDNLTEIMDMPVASRGEQTVRVRDIATVKMSFKDAASIARVGIQPAVTIEISKRIGENIIETVDNIKTVVAAASKKWPQGLHYSFTGDQSIRIRTMLSDLQNSVIFAILLVMIVMLAALGGRSALLVATAIPGSFLMAITVLFSLGFTTNVVVLFALILSVGMLVDGAIVVTELADKKMRDGATRKEAFGYAAKYMAWPIIASTATTLTAFFPLVFWPGIVGEFMKFMPITLIFTLTASLLMALLFLPMLGSNVGKKPQKFLGDGGKRYADIYGQLLEKALDQPFKVLGATVFGFIAVIFLYGVLGKGVEFFPDIEPDQGKLNIHSKGDYSLKEQDDVMWRMANRLKDIENVETLYITTGKGNQRSSGPNDIIGSIFMELKEWEDRQKSATAIFDEARELVGGISGVRVEKSVEQGGPRQGKPIKVLAVSDDYRLLPGVINQIQTYIESFKGTENVANSLPNPGIEWALDIDRGEATKAGTDVTAIGRIIRMATTGLIIGTYRPQESNDELDITIRLQNDSRTLGNMDDLTLFTSEGRVPLANFVTRKAQQKITDISRLDLKNTFFVEADVKEGFLANDIVLQIKNWIKTLDLPPGVRVLFKGEDKDQKEAQSFLMKAFLVAIFMMALILVTQFNSFYQAGIILSAVILSTTGVLIGHIIMGKPFGIVMSGLGVISLAGIVVNNNIVLIDTFNKLHRELPWREALVETGKSRLRPVALTAITTIIGLMPMALKINVDMVERHFEYNSPSTQWWDQLASSIAFGLTFATVLTLIITPCMIAAYFRLTQKNSAAEA